MSVAIFMMRKPQVVQTIMRVTKTIRINTIILSLGFFVAITEAIDRLNNGLAIFYLMMMPLRCHSLYLRDFGSVEQNPPMDKRYKPRRHVYRAQGVWCTSGQISFINCSQYCLLLMLC
jgi:hypothetical protein